MLDSIKKNLQSTLEFRQDVLKEVEKQCKDNPSKAMRDAFAVAQGRLAGIEEAIRVVKSVEKIEGINPDYYNKEGEPCFHKL
jgi:predicted translin family RNA/ssDNA-binding protein